MVTREGVITGVAVLAAVYIVRIEVEVSLATAVELVLVLDGGIIAVVLVIVALTSVIDDAVVVVLAFIEVVSAVVSLVAVVVVISGLVSVVDGGVAVVAVIAGIESMVDDLVAGVDSVTEVLVLVVVVIVVVDAVVVAVVVVVVVVDEVVDVVIVVLIVVVLGADCFLLSSKSFFSLSMTALHCGCLFKSSMYVKTNFVQVIILFLRQTHVYFINSLFLLLVSLEWQLP